MRKKYRVLISKNAFKDLRKLEKRIVMRIYKKLRFLGDVDEPLRFARKIQNPKIGEYRFRVGDYRVFFDVKENDEIRILYILYVKHRREAY